MQKKNINQKNVSSVFDLSFVPLFWEILDLSSGVIEESEELGGGVCLCMGRITNFQS